jgi:predicted DNA-binding protein (UPF0251 family)
MHRRLGDGWSGRGGGKGPVRRRGRLVQRSRRIRRGGRLTSVRFRRHRVGMGWPCIGRRFRARMIRACHVDTSPRTRLNECAFPPRSVTPLEGQAGKRPLTLSGRNGPRSATSFRAALRKFVPCPLPVPHSSWEWQVDNKTDRLAGAALFFGDPGHGRRTDHRHHPALPGRLPEDEREVFDLIGIQGLTHAEAAAVVGVSEKTVQRRLNRAGHLLAERLADLHAHQGSGDRDQESKDTPAP